jgi:GTP-binding protein
MVRWRGYDFVVADIPGIIEGAHTGTGLGLRFLRHIERTRILLFLIDLSPDNPREPMKELEILTHELTSYSQDLLDRNRIIVFNKSDLTGSTDRAKEAVAFVRSKGYPCFTASGLTGTGLEAILDEIIRELYEDRNQGGAQEV